MNVLKIMAYLLLCTLYSLMEKWLQFLKEKEAAFTWRIPNISLLEHFVFEDFIYSSDYRMNANFRNKEQVLKFSIYFCPEYRKVSIAAVNWTSFAPS